MVDRLAAVGAVLVVILLAGVFLALRPASLASWPSAPLAIQSVEGNRVLITNFGQAAFPKPRFVFNNETITASGGQVAANATSTYIVNLPPVQLQNARVSIRGSVPDNRAAPTVLITTSNGNAALQVGSGQSSAPPSQSGNGQTASPPYSTPVPPADSSAGFVTASGTGLMLDGRQYRFVGVNVYGLASDAVYNCGGNPDNPNEYVETVFSILEQKHVNVVRFWAFQSFSHDNFVAIDRVVNAAKRHNVKLILVLENQWADCTQGGQKPASWYANPNAAYGSYALSYAEYAARITARYKAEPAILMWQLMNEAESSDANNLLGFARTASQAIKSIDHNHLVSLGTLGTGQPGTEDNNYIALHSLPTIDIVEAHDYGHETQPLPGYPWNGDHNYIDTIAADLAISKQLNKPFFIGEAGIANTAANRSALFEAKINAEFSNSTVGFLIWRFELSRQNGGNGCSDEYCFDESDPIANVFANRPV